MTTTHRPGEPQHSHPLRALLTTRAQAGQSLALVLALTSTYTVAEVVGGVLTGSLALLADAGHMLSDVGALGLAVLALWYASRPATPRHSYGRYRAETLAALANGLTLLVIVLYILWEAYRRLQDPPTVQSAPMLGIAVGGLLVNLTGILILSRARQGSLNVEGAFLHVLGDSLGSVGAIAAALVMLATGWYQADPIISVVIALVIAFSALGLLRRTTNVLMEAAPPHIDPLAVREKILSHRGVRSVHDLHLWSLTSGFVALSAHVVAAGPTTGPAGQRILHSLRHRLRDEMDIHHVTIQLEEASAAGGEEPCPCDPRCEELQEGGQNT